MKEKCGRENCAGLHTIMVSLFLELINNSYLSGTDNGKRNELGGRDSGLETLSDLQATGL